MSAKTVTDTGNGRDAVLRAMQEAAENASGGNGGALKGPPGTRGIVVLSNDTSYIPEDKHKKKHGGGGSVDNSDEGLAKPASNEKPCQERKEEERRGFLATEWRGR